MLYIVCKITNDTGKPIMYNGFETLSQSSVSMSEDSLKNILENDIIQVANAIIQNNNITLTEWVNGIALRHKEHVAGDTYFIKHSGAKYVIISKENERYSLVDYDGTLRTNTAEGITDIVVKGKVANCTLERSGGKNILHTTDVYIINKDKEFENYIQSKYDSYIAKTLVLGIKDSTFEYRIENSEVRLSRYTGQNTDVILPSFITAIGKNAFRYPGITTIKFNSGLKIIGESALATALMSKVIAQIEIPESVGLICNKAFEYNKKLLNADGLINAEKFKLLGNKTVILDQE